MHYKTLCLLIGLALSCSACNGRSTGQRLNELEEQVANTDATVESVHGRVVELEHNVDTLNNNVRAQAQQKYEVRTKNGKNTNYVVMPVPAAPVPQVQAPDLKPTNGAAAAPVATPVATSGATPAGAPAAPVSPQPVVVPAPSSAAIAAVSPATTGTAPVRTSAPKAVTPTPVTPRSVTPTPSAQTPAAQSTPQVTPVVIPAPSQNGNHSAALTPPQPAGNGLALPPEGSEAPASPAYTAGQAQPVVIPAPTQGNGASPAVQPQPVAPAQVQQPAAQPAARGANGAYQTALRQIMGGQYTQGRASMQAFLQQYPQSKLAANGHYWIGESYYAERNYPEALAEFKQVSVQYPQHHKTADALLKAGMTYQRLGDQQNATMQFQALLSDFPNSQAAQIVRSKGWAR